MTNETQALLSAIETLCGKKKALMTNETQALLSAIETLCGKKKAKLLRRLAKAAVKAERENERQLISNPLHGRIDCIGGVAYADGTVPSVSTTDITWASGEVTAT